MPKAPTITRNAKYAINCVSKVMSNTTVDTNGATHEYPEW